MSRKTTKTPQALLALLTLSLGISTAIHAEEIDIDADPFPSQAYPGDHIAVPLLGGGTCNAAVPDPTQPPRIELAEHIRNNVDDTNDDVYIYSVEYSLKDDPTALCGTPPPPGFFYADVGTLPNGNHRFNVVGEMDGQEHVSYQTWDATVAPFDRPGENISGIWYAPDQSGRGFMVQRSGTIFALYWATHDDEGQPTWVTMVAPDPGRWNGEDQNTYAGDAVTTAGDPLSQGPAALDTIDWGPVSFTYEGCGRATFEWGPRYPLPDGEVQPDPMGSEGSLALRQVTVPDGVEPCDAVARSNGLVAEWVE